MRFDSARESNNENEIPITCGGIDEHQTGESPGLAATASILYPIWAYTARQNELGSQPSLAESR